MSNERIQMQGRKVEKQRELRELEMKADNLVINIRQYIDPFEEWVELETEHALTAMKELDGVVKRGKKLKSDILKLKKALGEA